MKKLLMLMLMCAATFACKKKEAAADVETVETTVAADTISTSESQSQMVYACPMHPEVTSSKKSTCPKCGMDLVAEVSP